MSAPAGPTGRLANMPVSFFAVVMGLTGLAIAWEKAGHVFGFSPVPGIALTLVASLVFVVLLVAYGAKVVAFRGQVRAELDHPVKLSFVPTISISFLLLAIAWLGFGDGGPWATVARGLWIIGTVVHFVLTLFVLGSWMHRDRYRVEHMNPAWFIPAVGNVIIPVAGVPLGYAEIGWFFFSAGIMSWLVLLALVTNRILFHEPMESRLLPTLFILIAPPAVGFIAWVRLGGGELDGAGRVLYFFALFLATLLLARAPVFARLAFGLPSWAYSFPLAALTIATLLMHELSGGDVYAWLGAALLAFATGVVALLAVLTARDMAAGRICVPGR